MKQRILQQYGWKTVGKDNLEDYLSITCGYNGRIYWSLFHIEHRYRGWKRMHIIELTNKKENLGGTTGPRGQDLSFQ